jgi:hypothetical protein
MRDQFVIGRLPSVVKMKSQLLTCGAADRMARAGGRQRDAVRLATLRSRAAELNHPTGL